MGRRVVAWDVARRFAVESVIVTVALALTSGFAVGIGFATLLANAFITVIASVVLAALVLTVLAGTLVCGVLRASGEGGHGHHDDNLQVGDLVKEKEGKEQTGKVIELLGENVKVLWTGEDEGTPDEEENNCESLMEKGEETSTLPKRKQKTSQLVKILMKAKQEVRVRVHVLKVVNIDLAAQTFTVDVQFEASWVSQELKEHLKSLNKEVKDVLYDEKNTNQERGGLRITVKNGDKYELVEKEFFAPRLKLTNLIAKVNQEKWFDFYGTKELSGEHGPVIVCYKWKLEQATFQESMELGKFPFDKQLLTMKLCTGWPLDDQENSVQLVQNKKSMYRSFVTTDDFLQSSEYKLSKVLKFEWKYTKRADSASEQTYSLLHCSMHVERRIGYWYTNVMLPIFIVTSCVLPSYAVPPDEFGDRAAILFTLLLAQVAYKYVIADKLPKISYMTLLDSYVFACFAATFIVIILQFCENRNIIPQRVLQCSNFTMSGCTVMNTSSVNDEIPVSTATPTPTTTTSWTGIDLSPPVREVQLSVYFLWLSITWLGLHLFLVCAFAFMKFQRYRKSALWNCSRTSVWVSPFNFADDTGPGPVVSIEITDAGAEYDSAPEVKITPAKSGGTPATATATVKGGKISDITITCAGSGYTSPPNVTLSAPKNGGKQATATATLAPTRKECEEALEALSKTDLDNKEASSIILWTPKEANETLKNSGSCDKCYHPCAVVRFEGPHAEERATELVNKFKILKNELCNPLWKGNEKKNMWRKYYPLKNTKGEHLSQGYKALEDCKTYQRLGAGRFVPQIRGSRVASSPPNSSA